MSSTRSSGGQQPLSLAEAKLERQNKRIETANAALTSHPPVEKPKQRKPKAWKPFGFGTEIPTSNQAQASGLAKVESRINIFRAPSQGAPLSRPVSRISTHTQQSTASEFERRDSSFLEADDFQLFAGRRKGRQGTGASEEKPSSQYATVEATFSKRAITEVFGNELPGPAFMDSTPGTANGQLQFIQHPNGDVSAHQWSSSRFGWENVGQFSNIRKRIEGQLAAFRLKGETASQAVQQNTLAYFRAVAKQREADVMGLLFGPKEIAACLPDTRPPATAPTGPRRVTSKVEMPERPSTMMSRQDSQSSHPVAGSDVQFSNISSSSASDHMPRAPMQSVQANPRFNPALNFVPKPRTSEHEDPFVSATPFHGAYGGVSTAYDHHVPSFQHPYYQHWAPPMGYHHGPVAHMQNNYYCGQTYAQPAPAVPADQVNMAEQIGRLRMKQSSAYESRQHGFSSAPIVAPQSTVSIARPPSPREVVPPVVQSKPASPLETRTAMREHVIKMGEQAKERTKSQANIRTVLYDPFQDHAQKVHASKSEEAARVASQPSKQDPFPMRQAIALPAECQKAAQNSFGLPALSLDVAPGLNGLGSTAHNPFPTTLAPSVRMPVPSAPSILGDDLPHISPDRKRDFRRAPGKGDAKPLLSMLTSSPSSSTPINIWDPDELDDWFWGGKKFSRQTDFAATMNASDATPHRRKKPSTIKPIGPPSRQQPMPDSTPETNFLTTRHLIPVLENLAQYVQGSTESRRDCFCQWTKAPEWTIDRSANGNDSFFDNQWGQPPARIGRDPRYQPMPRNVDVRFGAFEDIGHAQAVAMPGLDRRFGYGGRF